MSQSIYTELKTAEARRQTWEAGELIGYPDEDQHVGLELLDLLSAHFQVLETVMGEDTIAPHLRAMLQDPQFKGNTWREAWQNCPPHHSPSWPAMRLIDHAGLYGFYGVTPADVPVEDRADWLATLAGELERFLVVVKPDQLSILSRLANLALSRHAIDTCEGDVDLQSLALFGGVTEGRIRNILSSGDGGLEKIGQRVTAASAAAWLKGRKEFFASIWRQPDEEAPRAPSPDFSNEVVFVPVAADGSIFHAGLQRNGKFTIGAKGEEVQHATFDAALAALQQMATPRWRRPNEVGNWGIVSGREWKRIERRQLMSM